LIACPFVFLAGFIDSIAGGGGLISLPAYYMVGLPPHTALGTNKLSSSIGMVISTGTYLREGFVYKPLIPITIAGALIGSWIGARSVLLLDESILRWIMVIAIPVLALVIVFKKDLLSPEKRDIPVTREQVSAVTIALVIGWYDGFFGPGAGTFLMLAFVGIMKLDAVTACGNTKVVNLCSNLAAVAVFATAGTVNYALALPCAAFSILGNALGARLTIKNGAKLIKPVMLVVVLLLMATIVRDLL
jgi:hypothetical protein